MHAMPLKIHRIVTVLSKSGRILRHKKRILNKEFLPGARPGTERCKSILRFSGAGCVWKIGFIREGNRFFSFYILSIAIPMSVWIINLMIGR